LITGDSVEKVELIYQGVVTRKIGRRKFLGASAAVGVGALLPMWPASSASPSTTADADRRAAALVAQMTLDEKISMVHGMPSDSYIGYVPGVERLKVPALLLTDGPAGIRTPKQTSGPSTAFPAPIALAACFDLALAGRVGRALGSEAKAKAQNVVFAPIVNLARVPEGGRLFEGFGEDPTLTAAMAVEVIDGIQSMGVIATVKHWIANDQEDNRHLVSATVSERTLREVYLPPFAAAITKARVGSIMAANNRVNGAYNAENVPLLRELLKGELGFKGFVCSDYAATHDTVRAALGGLDLDLPTDLYFGAPLKAAIESGAVPVTVLDDKVHRLLRTMISFGIVDGNGTSSRGGPGAANTPQHAELAQQVAERGTVLAKNEPKHGRALLPLKPNATMQIAVVGPFAATPRIGGDGSSHVVPTASVSPVVGITARFANATVTTAPGAYADFETVPTSVLNPPNDATHTGLSGQYFSNESFSGTPALIRIDAQVDQSWNLLGPGNGLPTTNFSVRWTGTLTPTVSGTHTLATRSDDGSQVWVDGVLIVDNAGEHDVRRRSGTVDLRAGHAYDLRIDYVQKTFRASIVLQWIQPADDLIAAAVAVARDSDVVLVCVSDIESEGIDRENLALPGQQDQLIAAVAAANPRTIVVANVGGPVTMPWLAKVPTVLIGWYGGQQDGTALARVLAGDVDPGGRLPVTFGRHESDYPARSPERYPGVDFVENYGEGAFIGYRHFDALEIEPMFCFGHGLSYTTFRYQDMQVTKQQHDGALEIRVQVSVVNTGDRAGDEVVQLYVGQPANGAPTPSQVLRKFARVHLGPGQRQTVTMTLAAEDLSRWGVRRHAWYIPRGIYRIAIGSSSRHIRVKDTVTIARELPGAG
jgi:beta-glucosidase